MTELKPVAYMLSDFVENDFVSLTLPDHPNNPRELYFKEQLQPRVKMTQAEYDEWQELYDEIVESSFSVHKMLDLILDSTGRRGGKYTELAKRVYQDDDFMSVSKKQSELVDLFINYSPDHPEETIEIEPEKKWFVRIDSQIPLPDENIYLDDELIVYPRYDSPKSGAHQFDTKEQAEEWKNPLTEVVLLPVEGEQ